VPNTRYLNGSDLCHRRASIRDESGGQRCSHLISAKNNLENDVKLPHRRKFLHLAAGAAALPTAPRITWAQSYPTRPVRIILGVAAGGAQDIIGRLIGQWLSERLGQPFVIENRPGAGGNVAAETVVRSAPDGHTLLMVTPVNAINATLYEKLNFNFIQDIVPVAGIDRVPYVMLLNPSVQATTIPEFIAYAKSNPGKLNMASAGIGTGTHVCGELFKILTDVKMLHIPYRGGSQLLSDLLTGQVQVYFGILTSSVEYIRAGKLRALAVTTAARSEVLPSIPTVAEFVPGYEASIFYGLGAPRDTPAEVIAKLNREINAAFADPKMKAWFAEMGATVLPGSPADFGKLLAEETEKWGKVIRAANIKPE
jgi:tripartite-type tricarboxylate transporter receptor subunit TctC